MTDAIASLPGTDVIIYTVSGGLWRGRVDHVIADSAGDVNAIVTDAGVIVPWISVDAIIPQPAPVSP